MLGDAIRSSSWLFPVIESVHLVALTVIGGTVLLLDLRMLGWTFPNQPVSRIARDAQPWLTGSLLVMVPTGILLFLSESKKCYYSDAFWVKMSALLPAILFTFTVRRKVAAAADARVRPVWLKLVAVVSLTLWFIVGAAGRWIGFSG
jgi:hypothetical protein